MYIECLSINILSNKRIDFLTLWARLHDVIAAVIESVTERVTVAGGRAWGEDATPTDTTRRVSSHLASAESIRAPHAGSAVSRTGALVQGTVSKVCLVASAHDRGEVRSKITCTVEGLSKCLSTCEGKTIQISTWYCCT